IYGGRIGRSKRLRGDAVILLVRGRTAARLHQRAAESHDVVPTVRILKRVSGPGQRVVDRADITACRKRESLLGREEKLRDVRRALRAVEAAADPQSVPHAPV